MPRAPRSPAPLPTPRTAADLHTEARERTFDAWALLMRHLVAGAGVARLGATVATTPAERATLAATAVALDTLATLLGQSVATGAALSVEATGHAVAASLPVRRAR